jgi:hypothetical protein
MPEYKKPKYHIGEAVYSYQNPSVARKINYIRAGKFGDRYSITAYRLTLLDNEGQLRNSNWINENSLSKRKQR